MSKMDISKLTPEQQRALLKKMMAKAGQKKTGFPLSPAQLGVWVSAQLHPGSFADHLLNAYYLEGHLNQEALEQALKAMVKRHAPMRTTFALIDNEPKQVVASDVQIPLENHDLSAKPEAERDGLAHRLIVARTKAPFDLVKGPLWRFVLVRYREDLAVLAIVAHHIVADNWSFKVVNEDLRALYDKACSGAALTLPALQGSYTDYAEKANQAIQSAAVKKQLAFWQDALAGIEPISLQEDFQRPARQSFNGATFKFSLSEDVAVALRNLAKDCHASTYMVFVSAFMALLQRYSGREVISVGAPSANRNSANVEAMVGFFVNTLVFKADFSQRPGFKALVAQVRDFAMEAFENAEAPYHQIIEALKLPNDLGRNPLAPIVFQSGMLPELKMAGLKVKKAFEADYGIVRSDLEFYLNDIGDGLAGVFVYNQDLYRKETMRLFAGHFSTLLSAMLVAPEVPTTQLSYLSDKEQAELLELSHGDSVTAEIPCLHRQIEAAVAANGSAIALRVGDETMTYEAFNAKAETLAKALVHRGIGLESSVGICMARGFNQLVSIFAVLKAGAAYVPMDPTYPEDRLLVIVEECTMPLLLVETGTKNLIADVDLTRLDIDAMWAAFEAEAPIALPSPCSDNAAYVIFTSGSTGRPKGTIVSHGAIGNTLAWRLKTYPMTTGDVVLQTTSFSFDASLWELFAPLFCGACLDLSLKGGVDGLAEAATMIAAHKVTKCQMMPSWLKVFLEGEGIEALASFRDVITGAESLPLSVQQLAERRLPSLRVSNLYGPTEAALDTTAWICQKGDSQKFAPIGRPIDNVTVYLLDEQMHLARRETVGALHIAGNGLARGYLARPALTASVFLPDPFSDQPGARMYHSGDHAMWDSMGQITFAGRDDRQIKIRGFRVELGEVEAALYTESAIQLGAVKDITNASGNKMLVAYLVTEGDQKAVLASLRERLSEQIPEYMVPSYFVFLDDMPRSSNGKVDYRNLPDPEMAEEERPYVAPRTEVEAQLVGLWKEILKVETVGVTDNFFQLGGDSILVIQLASKATRAGMSLTPKLVFENQTIAELAAQVGLELTEAEQDALTGRVMLSPVQHWFFNQNRKRPELFNQAFLLGLEEAIEPARLKRALDGLVLHHDALRLRFTEKDGTWQSVYGAPGQGSYYDFEEVELDLLDALEADVAKRHEGLDIERGPIMRAVLYRHNGRCCRLLLTVNHLVIDGVSWRILLEDLELAYKADPSKDLDLGFKTTSWRAWVDTLEEASRSARFKKELEYWESRPFAPALAGDLDLGPDDVASEQSISLNVSQSLTRELLQDVHHAYRTRINDILLTALLVAHGRMAGDYALSLELEGHGRENLFDNCDLSRTVGWFTASYPVHLALAQPFSNFGAVIKCVKEALRAIPHNGLGYGLLRHLNSETKARLKAQSQPQLIFNYLGRFDAGEGSVFKLLNNSARGAVASEDLRPHALDIYGMIVDDALQFHFRASANRYSQARLQAFVDGYNNALQELVEHCKATRFGGYTPSDFPLVDLNQKEVDEIASQWPELVDLYPLTPMQQGMIFHSLYRSESLLYTQQICVGLRGTLDVARYRKAWEMSCARHTVLHGPFEVELGDPKQIVLPQPELAWEDLNWQEVAKDAVVAKLEALLLAIKEQGFEVTKESPQAFKTIRISADKHYFIWTHHHALLDGWSLPVLLQEVDTIYAQLSANQPIALEPAQNYRDYLVWLKGRDESAAKAFWRKRLAGFEQPNQLPLLSTNQDAADHDNLDLILPEALNNKVKAFSRKNGFTLSSLVQGVWSLLLSRYCGNDDIVFGITVSGRPPELEGSQAMVGLFINTLPLRVSTRKGIAVQDWLRTLQIRHGETLPYEWTPLNLSQAQSDAAAGTNLFETIVVFENYPMHETVAATWNGLQIEDVYFTEKVEYPMVLQVMPGSDLVLKFKHDPRRFSPQAIARMQRHLSNLIEAVVDHGAGDIGELSIFKSDEMNQILYEWNDTRKAYGAHLCMHELFEQQVPRTPDHIAARFGSQTISYRELNARSNRIARALVERGVRPGHLVGVCFERSIDMVAGVMAVLKTGGAYVPMDHFFPTDRIAFILEDIEAPLLLTQRMVLDKHPDLDWPSLCLDEHDFSEQDPTDLCIDIDPNDLAYIIFTSGSTGRPKGVILQHRPVINLIEWVNETYRVEDKDRLCFITSLCFDLSVYDIFGILAKGSEIYIVAEEDQKNPEALARILNEEGITFWDSAPAALFQLMSFLPEAGAGSEALRLIFLSGDWIPLSLPPAMKQAFKNVSVIGLGGATEATIWSNFFPVKEIDPSWVSIPYGYPIQNAAYYILDSALRPCAPGVPGDLYIGDRCLSRGYFNRPALTAERYFPNPYSKDPGGVLYTTGDRARWFADGKMEFLGRLDHQVKIRGYRIELGEVESAIQDLAQVQETVVMARDDRPGDKRLVAYIQPVGGDIQASGLSGRELRTLLKDKLPEYMVPSAFVVLETWPVTSNGKLDRKALPAPEVEGSSSSDAELKTEAERLLAQVWSDVLGAANLGRDDDFFELGGDSILAIQVVGRAKRLGLEFNLRDLFEKQTIKAIAAGLSVGGSANEGVVQDYEPEVVALDAGLHATLEARFGEIETVYEVAPIQHGMLFHYQLDRSSLMYHEQLSCDIKGDLDMDRFRDAWQVLVDRHPIMRTVFIADQDPAVQVVLKDWKLVWQVHDWPELDATAFVVKRDESLDKDLRASFDFEAGPPMRISIYRDGRGGAHFCLTFHHVLLDGWSFWILLREVVEVYEALLKGETPVLPPAKGFGSFVGWLQSRDQDAQKAFWVDYLADFTSATELSNKQDNAGKGIEHDAIRDGFEAAETEKLVAFAKSHDLTLNTLVMGGWSLVLAHYAGRDDVLFGTTASGRSPELEGVDTIVGPFLAAIPFRARLNRAQALNQWLADLQLNQMQVRLYESTPLVDIQKFSAMGKDDSLYHIIYTYYNDPFYESLAGAESTLEMENIRFEDENNFSLDLSARATPQLDMQIKFDKNRYLKTTIKRLMGNLSAFLRLAIEKPEIPLEDLLQHFTDNDKRFAEEEASSFRNARTRGRVRRKPVMGS